MFNPKYHISPRLLENIKRITLLTAELDRQHFTKVAFMELEKDARAVSSFSSTSIEGNPLPLTEVKKILKNTPKHIRDTEKEVLNYNKTLQELNLLVEENKTGLSLSLILQIHKGVMNGLIAKTGCGKLRNLPVFVNDPRVGKPVYLPPDHADVKKLMEELVDYLRKNQTHIDPLILAGIFHKQLVIIHPFIDGNGRTTRLVTKLLLASLGLNTFNLFSFENYYNKNVTRYFQKVGVFGNYYELKDTIDFTGWLEYFTDGIIDELLRVRKNLENIAVSPETELKPHHLKMIAHIEKTGYINDAQYAKLVKRAKATRSLDFNKLIELGKIQRCGKGKNTYYKAK
jgi:Fic family protein